MSEALSNYEIERRKLIPGNLELALKTEELWKRLRDCEEKLATFQAEVARGIMHREDWKNAMSGIAKGLPEMQTEYKAAKKAWDATIPPYDPDNHVGSCGCVIANGKRVKWCGDHY